MHRLIRTAAEPGSIVESDGRAWVVLGPSDWPGEARCRTADTCKCGAPANGPMCAACVEGAFSGLMAAADDDDDGFEPEDDIAAAISELEEAGLWETVRVEDPIDRLRARARAAHAELMELSRAH